MILVTGGAGFIGSNFVLDWLKGSDEPVLNLDKLTYAGNLRNLASLNNDARHRFVIGDIGDTPLIGQLLRQFRPRAVINFAAESHVDRAIRGPAAFVQTNIIGAFRLLDAVLAHFLTLPPEERKQFRFLQVSTDEIYGSLSEDAEASDEHAGYRPNNPYSASKAAADHLVRAYHHTYGLPVLTTHCSNNYGPYHFPEKVIPLCIRNALLGKPLPLYGDGLHIRDWLYVGDHCAALRRILEAGTPGATYNIGAGNEKTNLELVQTLCGLLDEFKPRPDGRPYAQQIVFVEDRPGHDRRYAIDAGKLRRELGWQPQEGFQSGLKKTVQWNLAHPDWLEQSGNTAYEGWIAHHYGVTP